ncbi:MAG: hypothetical protein ACREL7_13960 [Longimicrobiales bacterium]
MHSVRLVPTRDGTQRRAQALAPIIKEIAINAVPEVFNAHAFFSA